MSDWQLINWLLEGDVSIQYQTHRDLLGTEKPSLRRRIAKEGWGAQFLSKRNSNGHWGQRFYQPKWTSTHYTLLDLKNLNIGPRHKLISESIQLVSKNERGMDEGINPAGSTRGSDVCINGMFLNYATYFGLREQELESVVDFLISQYMDDGGFNCRSNRGEPVHSSVHSTISVLEGITEYERNGYTYRLSELIQCRDTSVEFLLMHKLYRSDRTGEIIHPNFLKIPYPCRWRYDILRALDYFQYAKIRWDDRMQSAIEVLLQKRNKDGTWNVQAKYAGQLHFEMEKAGKPSRWNTLRCLRVLQMYSGTLNQ